ncbi:hypothetical protein [Novosphingobium album (ex Liu et al. 2023)]|uniref:Uncharacterized protein n=1 Tax=Novosphingobium album (ex Liu et al. 2023) TaxID=3031130 RepID=A0ABT5WV95_9SPHN|nr:hypothetical protein [Novosphingobium album (ex Liu et al. 2023)]MDE8653829.1 hypothetical protein [Novosphingobium album (ex Liu et al. 2023)]
MHDFVPDQPQKEGLFMVEWHRRTSACIALRLSGVVLVGGGWLLGQRLTGMIQAYPHEASPAEFLLGMVVLACFSASMALAIVGPGLFEQVAISARWAGQAYPAHGEDGPAARSGRP